MGPLPTFILAFSADTATSNGLGFRRAEVRSAYLVRYRDADFQSMDDTLRQPTAATASSRNPVFVIYYRPGFPPQFDLPAFERQNIYARSFRLVVPAANRTYAITNVVLKQEPGVKFLPLPVDVLAALKTASLAVLADVAASDPMAKKVYESLQKFQASAKAWHEVSEEAFYSARR